MFPISKIFLVGDFMYIFPQNYNFKNKLFGLIDYSTIIFNLIWYLFIYSFLSLLIKSFYIKLCLFISLSFPIFLISIIGFNHENIIYVLSYMIKFYRNKHIYLYLKY